MYLHKKCPRATQGQELLDKVVVRMYKGESGCAYYEDM